MNPEKISMMNSPAIDLPVPGNQFNYSFKINKKKLPSLPPEILTIIFQHLNEQDLQNVSLTCRNWKLVYNGIQIQRMNSLIYAIYKKKCRYVDRYIEKPIKKLTDTQNLMLIRKILIRGLFKLKRDNLNVKFNKNLNVNNYKIVDGILKTSNFLFFLYCLFNDKDISVYCFNIHFNACLKNLELKDVFYVMNHFPNLSELIVKEAYRCIFLKENLKSSLKLLSNNDHENWTLFHDEMFEFIILLPKNRLGPQKLISLIKNNFKDKQSRYDFLKKISEKLVVINRSFLTEIIEFLPLRSKSRAYCLAGMSKGYLIQGKISKSVKIAKLIRVVKLRSNLLCENIELLITIINDEINDIGGFKTKADFLSLVPSLKKGFFDLLLGLLLMIDAIPNESIKKTVEKDVIQRCKDELGFVFNIKFNRKDLNSIINSPITYKRIRDRHKNEYLIKINKKIEIEIDFVK